MTEEEKRAKCAIETHQGLNRNREQQLKTTSSESVKSRIKYDMKKSEDIISNLMKNFGKK